MIKKWLEGRSAWFWTTVLLAVVWLGGILVVVATSWRLHEEQAISELDLEAGQLAGELDHYLKGFENIAPQVAALRTLRGALMNPSPDGMDTLNRFLFQTNKSLGSENIFVLNMNGLAIGSSNHADANSFVGYNFAFRPYFQQAVLGEPGSYYAKGVVSTTRGYFFSAPILENGRILGVAVVKISLEELFAKQRREGHRYILVGYDSIVFAASEPEWELRSLQAIPESQLRSLRASRRYGNASLAPLYRGDEFDPLQSRNLILPSNAVSYRYVVGRALIPDAGWQLYTLMPHSEILRRTLQFSAYYSLIFGLLVVWLMYWKKRQEVQRHVRTMNQELERRVTELTSELTESNAELQELVAHYQRTQNELESTQDQLIQTAKLALLGEMSAGLNHELNQPLLALQTYAENSLKLAERGKFETVKSNLGEILQITGTMHAIVSRFKVFARRSPPEPRRVEVGEVIDSALVIMKPLLNKVGIQIQVPSPKSQAVIFCEPVQIQQVLVNLVTNAAEAMQEVDPDWRPKQHLISIEVLQVESRVEIRVSDNGPGIAKDMQNRIFEPFFTTKSKGLGIGLALSRRILEALAGSLSAEPGRDGGSVFIISLPAVATETFDGETR
ncbi:sensor histidine kinase [Parathalassolituus penaei]|uniref:histidine kinase n=1 Tax=Parathalassolituus penaei TaxID=2997323 RepID=A0A9X3IV27_9GAMM|nr:ATP-binding protein [Parathalassolituus penaei]MCY0966803.1 ATP-binding protein [Parathalassolituus penaei]